MRWMVGATAGLAIAGAAQAEVTEQAAQGFQIRHVAEIAAPPARVWDALVQPSLWWEPNHTWSGQARNLRIEARPGGCFCEDLPGGGAAHMSVVQVQRDKQLNLYGALGPLSTEGVAGGMVIKLTPAGQGTRLEMTYTVGGFAKGGLQKWPGPVDMVLGTQFRRLERYVETGNPAATAPR